MRGQLILAHMNERFIEHDYDYEHTHIEHSIEMKRPSLGTHARGRDGCFCFFWSGLGLGFFWEV